MKNQFVLFMARSIASLAFVVILPMLLVNLLISHAFVGLEYRMPWFPADSYGFSQNDRLFYAEKTVDALRSGTVGNDLASLTLVDGNPLYNQREIDHLVDVKLVVDKLNRVALGSFFVFGFCGLLLWSMKQPVQFSIAIKKGSQLLAVLLVSLGLFAAASFWNFFAWFHSLFFAGDTWLFRLDDSLIRLFPIRFWQDAVVLLVGGTLLIALYLGFFWKPKNGKGVTPSV